MSLDDKYTYPGSGGVLVNLLDIHDPALLDKAMRLFASRGLSLIQADQAARLDFEYLQSIHRLMFGELLSWAGEIRDVDAQAVGAGIPYALPSSSSLRSTNCSRSSPQRTTSQDSTDMSSSGVSRAGGRTSARSIRSATGTRAHSPHSSAAWPNGPVTRSTGLASTWTASRQRACWRSLATRLSLPPTSTTSPHRQDRAPSADHDQHATYVRFMAANGRF